LQAAQDVQQTSDEQARGIQRHAAQHGASIQAQFAVQHAAATADFSRHRQEFASGVQRQSQQVQSHATQQSVSVGRSAAATQETVQRAATTHSTAVNTTGIAQSQRVHTVLGLQAARLSQRGAAAAGSYGGDEKGHAQGTAARDVAGKGQSVFRAPVPAIAGDVNQTAAQSSQHIVATGGRVASRVQAHLPAIQRRIQGTAEKTASGLQSLVRRGSQQLTAAHGKVTAGLRRKQGEALSELRRHADKARGALVSVAARHRREVQGATRTAMGKLRTETAALARAAAHGHEAGAVAAALDRARAVVSANVGRFIDRVRTGVASFQGHGAQYGAAVEQRLAQGAQAANGQAREVTAQSDAAGRQLSARGVAHATQGARQATHGVDDDTRVAGTRHRQVSEAATVRFAQVATQTTDALGSRVDLAASQNDAYVGGQVDRGMTSAAAAVGADHDKSLLDKVVDFLKSAWDWLSSVAKAVADVVIDAFLFVAGAVLQVISNQLFGLLDPLLDMVDSDAFQHGRDFGDAVLTFLTGALLILGGIAILGGGAALSFAEIVTTAGVSIPVVIVQDGVLVTVAVGLIADGLLMMSKASKQSGKERGSDIPSWAKGSKMNPGETPAQAADQVMRQRYPDGNYPTGPGSEYNKIKKFFERSR
jgi:hypothetical protein